MIATLPSDIDILSYKERVPLVWIVFIGGTGTGKSTLFNRLCDHPVSLTGAERPKTAGSIAYAYGNAPIDRRFPIPYLNRVRTRNAGPTAGEAGELMIFGHDRKTWSHLVFVDTPDLDSLRNENRRVAEDMYRLSDVVVFVTSQEKYADEVPSHFLERMVNDKRHFYILLNKVQDPSAKEAFTESLRALGIDIQADRIWPIYFASGDPYRALAAQGGFNSFLQTVEKELSGTSAMRIRTGQRVHRAVELKEKTERLIGLLEKEREAGRRWGRQLERFFEMASAELIESETRRFDQRSREYIRSEVRKLFVRYDVLAKPRQIIREIISTPFRLLGFGKANPEALHKEVLFKARQRMDFSPIESAMENFNRFVFEALHSKDSASPLLRKLQEPGVILTESEIHDHIWNSQERLAEWLEQTFRSLSEGLPKRKRWGIYSTSILWGILIISFEAVLGGGFSVLNMVLDSALAPFLTRGTVELFAYGEIQKIAQEMANRYREGLLSALRSQKNRYRECLESLTTGQKTFSALRELQTEIQRFADSSKKSENGTDRLQGWMP